MDEQLETISSVLDIPSLKAARLERHSEEPTWWPMLFDYLLPSSLIHLLSALLLCNPQKRLSAPEACAHPFFKDVRGPGAALPNGNPLPEPFVEYATICVTEEPDSLAGKTGLLKLVTRTDRRKWTWRNGTQGTGKDPLTWLPQVERKREKF